VCVRIIMYITRIIVHYPLRAPGGVARGRGSSLIYPDRVMAPFTIALPAGFAFRICA